MLSGLCPPVPGLSHLAECAHVVLGVRDFSFLSEAEPCPLACLNAFACPVVQGRTPGHVYLLATVSSLLWPWVCHCPSCHRPSMESQEWNRRMPRRSPVLCPLRRVTLPLRLMPPSVSPSSPVPAELPGGQHSSQDGGHLGEPQGLTCSNSC